MIYKNLKKGDFNPEIAQVINEIDNLNIYEKYFKIDEGDVVVDIGAHVGIFTRKAAKLASMVYAIEPDPQFYKELKKLTAKNVVAIHAGISGNTGKSTILSNGHANQLGSGDIEIDTLSFKDLVDRGIDRIDFLKLDCEGGEYDILNDENIEWIVNNCNKIAGEFHIHSDDHRRAVVDALNLFEEHDIEYILTDITGNPISRAHFQSRLDFYTEILFYASCKQELKLDNSKDTVLFHFNRGAYAEVRTESNDLYRVEIYDQNRLVHGRVLGNKGFVRTYGQYYIPYRIIVTNTRTNEVLLNHSLDLKGKRVVIEFTSKALGDTIAWFPYAEEFRQKHDCDLHVVTFHNSFFKDYYTNIKFVEPGARIDNVYAWYPVGWWYNEDGNIDLSRNPTDPRSRPMQQTASDILGLEYKEIKPIIYGEIGERPIDNKYICIANHSTSQAKYWNNPLGWDQIVSYYNLLGYDVVLLSRENDGHNGNKNPIGVIYPENYDISTVMTYLEYCDMFIGIGSGLSWLAWAMDTPTVVISGFSEPYTEPADVRITSPAGKCSGCFNRRRLQDDGDWNWCPDHKGTNRQFECSSSISAMRVINKISESGILDKLGKLVK